jgi:hypothetical protein
MLPVLGGISGSTSTMWSGSGSGLARSRAADGIGQNSLSQQSVGSTLTLGARKP